jgi:hypothetical protein
MSFLPTILVYLGDTYALRRFIALFHPKKNMRKLISTADTFFLIPKYPVSRRRRRSIQKIVFDTLGIWVSKTQSRDRRVIFVVD